MPRPLLGLQGAQADQVNQANSTLNHLMGRQKSWMTNSEPVQPSIRRPRLAATPAKHHPPPRRRSGPPPPAAQQSTSQAGAQSSESQVRPGSAGLSVPDEPFPAPRLPQQAPSYVPSLCAFCCLRATCRSSSCRPCSCPVSILASLRRSRIPDKCPQTN